MVLYAMFVKEVSNAKTVITTAAQVATGMPVKIVWSDLIVKNQTKKKNPKSELTRTLY